MLRRCLQGWVELNEGPKSMQQLPKQIPKIQTRAQERMAEPQTIVQERPVEMPEVQPVAFVSPVPRVVQESTEKQGTAVSPELDEGPTPPTQQAPKQIPKIQTQARERTVDEPRIIVVPERPVEMPEVQNVASVLPVLQVVEEFQGQPVLLVYTQVNDDAQAKEKDAVRDKEDAQKAYEGFVEETNASMEVKSKEVDPWDYVEEPWHVPPSLTFTRAFQGYFSEVTAALDPLLEAVHTHLADAADHEQVELLVRVADSLGDLLEESTATPHLDPDWLLRAVATMEDSEQVLATLECPTMTCEGTKSDWDTEIALLEQVNAHIVEDALPDTQVQDLRLLRAELMEFLDRGIHLKESTIIQLRAFLARL